MDRFMAEHKFKTTARQALELDRIVDRTAFGYDVVLTARTLCEVQAHNKTPITSAHLFNADEKPLFKEQSSTGSKTFATANVKAVPSLHNNGARESTTLLLTVTAGNELVGMPFYVFKGGKTASGSNPGRTSKAEAIRADFVDGKGGAPYSFCITEKGSITVATWTHYILEVCSCVMMRVSFLNAAVIAGVYPGSARLSRAPQYGSERAVGLFHGCGKHHSCRKSVGFGSIAQQPCGGDQNAGTHLYLSAVS